MSHFIDAHAWLDEDGQHVWLRHQCKPKPRVNTTMLPWPDWQTVGDHVEPSIICMECDLHAMNVPIGPPPADFWKQSRVAEL